MQNGLPVSYNSLLISFCPHFLKNKSLYLLYEPKKLWKFRSYLSRFPYSAIEQLVPLSAVQMKIGLQES